MQNNFSVKFIQFANNFVCPELVLAIIYDQACSIKIASIFLSTFLAHLSIYTTAVIGVDRFIWIKYKVSFKTVLTPKLLNCFDNCVACCIYPRSNDNDKYINEQRTGSQNSWFNSRRAGCCNYCNPSYDHNLLVKFDNRRFTMSKYRPTNYSFSFGAFYLTPYTIRHKSQVKE